MGLCFQRAINKNDERARFILIHRKNQRIYGVRLPLEGGI